MRRGLLALLLTASCARCGAPQSAASAEELLPQHPSGAVMTAPLGAVAEHLAALAATLAAIPGGEQLADLRKGVAAQLGFDVLTREGLVSAGIDPLRGAAVAVIEAQPRPEWVLAGSPSESGPFFTNVQKDLRPPPGLPPPAPHTPRRAPV